MNWIKQNWVKISGIFLIVFFVFIFWEFNQFKNKKDISINSSSNPTKTSEECPSTDVFWPRSDNINNNKNEFYTISKDGHMEAYVKGEDVEILVVNNSNKTVFEIKEKPDSDPYKNLTNFSNLQFSIDNKELYFNTSAWTTDAAIHALNLKTGQIRFIDSGQPFIVIPNGIYSGKIIAVIHKYFVGPGSYDWYWLVDPKTGEEIGPIGEDIGEFYDVYICSGVYGPL